MQVEIMQDAAGALDLAGHTLGDLAAGANREGSLMTQAFTLIDHGRDLTVYVDLPRSKPASDEKRTP